MPWDLEVSCPGMADFDDRIMTCLTNRSEMGWEIEDTVETLYKRLRYGKQKVPNASLVVM